MPPALSRKTSANDLSFLPGHNNLKKQLNIPLDEVIGGINRDLRDTMTNNKRYKKGHKEPIPPV